MINIKAVCDDCLFWLADTLAQIVINTSGERVSFLCRFLFISVPKSYGLDILKTCNEALKIIVHFMDVDGVDVGPKLS